MELRSVEEGDVERVQTLRKIGWQDNYVNPESGVTKEVLEKELASLPVPQKDIDYYLALISKGENAAGNIVAVMDGIVVGTVFYEQLENGNGDIGVFVDRDYRGKGIGSALLEELIKRTTNILEVTIFAKNQSRNLYKKFGFVEEGPETKHYFRDSIYLPTQKLILRR